MGHSIEDGRKTSSGANQIVSQRLQFASIQEDGTVANAGIAPHLNLRAAMTEEISAVEEELKGHWLSDDLEPEVKRFAIIELAQAHLKEVKTRRLPEVEKTEGEVQTPSQEGNQLLGFTRIRAERTSQRRPKDAPELGERAAPRGGPGRSSKAPNGTTVAGEEHPRRAPRLSVGA